MFSTIQLNCNVVNKDENGDILTSVQIIYHLGSINVFIRKLLMLCCFKDASISLGCFTEFKQEQNFNLDTTIA